MGSNQSTTKANGVSAVSVEVVAHAIRTKVSRDNMSNETAYNDDASFEAISKMMGFIPLYYVNKYEKEDKILSQPFEDV